MSRLLEMNVGRLLAILRDEAGESRACEMARW
jgi:hypothetical protein